MMDVEQLTLARHALGLPNHGKRSYRNRYFAAPRTSQAEAWRRLVEADLASFVGREGSSMRFCLTEAGARAALKPGERLDEEDFPSTSITEARTR